jgi:hypothetical protein
MPLVFRRTRKMVASRSLSGRDAFLPQAGSPFRNGSANLPTSTVRIAYDILKIEQAIA